MTRRLEGKPVASGLLSEAAEEVRTGVAAGRPPPALASVHPAGPGAFEVYRRSQERVAVSAGIQFRDEPIAASSDQPSLERRLDELNADRSVHAVLLQHPLPAPFDFFSAVARLRPEKDVDGVGPANLGRLASGRAMHVPAVAAGALALARHYGIFVEGHRVAVIGRSETVGRPLAQLLLARGTGGDATVTVAHSRTPRLVEVLRETEVIFSCAGRPGLLTRDVVPKGSVVIDIGLSTVPDPGKPGAVRTVGDADPDSLEGWVEAFTPVPGGVGPVTVAQLMKNVVHGWDLLTRERTS